MTEKEKSWEEECLEDVIRRFWEWLNDYVEGIYEEMRGGEDEGE